MATTLRIALLIDADNASVASLDRVLGELAEHGMANVRRAYGDWGSPHLKAWRQALLANAIQPMQQIAYTAKGNASDMAMVIDAMDLLHSGSFDAFALMSSDSDFTPLVMRLRSANMQVFGFGRAQTPDAFKRACSVFFHVDTEQSPGGRGEPEIAAEVAVPTAAASVAPANGTKPVAVAVPARATGEQLRADAQLMGLLRSAVEASERDGWAHLGAVGNYLVNRSAFTPKNYGYKNLKGLILASDRFELHKDGHQIRFKSQ